ncbi:glycosyltransferase family 1 protein [Neorhizobium lilium]|uniref:Glycosyltransferase family 1 protein n=1 Tax=Neorhizobium lilium TaxID=2503024 RepID=A0A3S3RUW6_9HYPH|nr:glycosyltransferase [Neorhizobium lilium]RWX78766.1 glycosyltransferase family 1 protein [Neorhizobium lilium]
MARRLYRFFSPIVPMTTGTATYFDKVLRRVLSLNVIEKSDIEVVIDSKAIGDGYPTHYHGVRVRDYREIPRVVGENETWFLFLANNDFHGYVHEIIDSLRKIAGGRVISIVHEPSNYMLLRHLSYNNKQDYSSDRLVKGLNTQFGDRGKRLLDDADKGLVDNIFNHVVLAQNGLYHSSDEIWTHSRFAAEVLRTENRGGPESARYRVYAHPKDDLSRHDIGDKESQPLFRIGIFGWISLAKRVREILVGLRLALDRLPSGAAKHIELIVVGKLPNDPNYDVISASNFLALSKNVRFLGYQPDEEFERLVTTCNLIYNLRFPSCGETSGTINLAQGTGARVVKTRYQAMNEEPAHEAMTFLPHFEAFNIASSICSNFEKWKLGLWNIRNENPQHMQIAPVEYGVLAEIFSATTAA